MSHNAERYGASEGELWRSVGLAPTERWIDFDDDTAVRVQEFGEGSPLLFVHGVGSSGANWAPLVANLPNFRCLVLDRPGCGLSEPAVAGRPFESVGEFNAFAESMIVDVLDAINLQRTSVVATSFGAYFTLLGAAAHPKRVASIVELAWPFGAPIAKVPLSMRIGSVPGMEAITAKIPPTRFAVRAILKQLGLKRALQNGRFSDEMFEWFLALLRHTDTLRNEQRASPKLVTPIQGQNPEVILGSDVLDRVTMPTLLLWGSEDPMGGTEIAEPFLARLPKASLEILPEAGHAPWIDEPELCARMIQDFLRL